MAKYRKLKDLKINEVSLVDRAANGRVFSVIKNNKINIEEPVEKAAKTDIEIKSDGSIENTVFIINGEQVNPANFWFSFYQYKDEYGEMDGNIACDMTIISPETEGGFKNVTSMYLADRNTPGDTMAVEKFLKNSGVVYEKDIDYMQLAKSAEVLDEYKGVIPTEVEEAVEYIKKVAVLRKNNKESEVSVESGAENQTKQLENTEIVEKQEKQDNLEKETNMEVKKEEKEEEVKETPKPEPKPEENKETEIAVFEMDEEKVGKIVQEKFKDGFDSLLTQVKESISQVATDFGSKLDTLQKEIEKKPEPVQEADEDVELDISELIRRAIKDELNQKK
jgi:hypothetical protein